MNHLVEEVVELFSGQSFEYAICGGQAIDLFLGYESRKHGDIDLMAYWEERDAIILYMQSCGYEVYEMLGDGKAHKITDIRQQFYKKRNMFCVTDDCELVHLESTEEKDIYWIEFLPIGQTKLNFVELLFNHKDATQFLYARNQEIRRELSKAILHTNGISYLAPELLLLYKSTTPESYGYQQDYELAYGKMNEEQKEWLCKSLQQMYPSGHPWLEKRL